MVKSEKKKKIHDEAEAMMKTAFHESSSSLTSEAQLQTISSSNLKKKKYKGVRMRSWGSWVSEIRAPNQKTRIWLGSYSTAEAAARAYDAALLCLKGPSANFNFPINTTTHDDHEIHNMNHHPPINNNIMMSPKSIQRVAAAAAAATTTPFASSPSPATYSLPSPPSSSLSSTPYSPSLSSSPISINEDEIISLVPDHDTFCADHDHIHEPMETGYTFDSPRYNDMINNTFFDPTFVEDVVYEEEDDIRLWSFC